MFFHKEKIVTVNKNRGARPFFVASDRDDSIIEPIDFPRESLPAIAPDMVFLAVIPSVCAESLRPVTLPPSRNQGGNHSLLYHRGDGRPFSDRRIEHFAVGDFFVVVVVKAAGDEYFPVENRAAEIASRSDERGGGNPFPLLFAVLLHGGEGFFVPTAEDEEISVERDHSVMGATIPEGGKLFPRLPVPRQNEAGGGRRTAPETGSEFIDLIITKL